MRGVTLDYRDRPVVKAIEVPPTSIAPLSRLGYRREQRPIPQ